MTSDDFDGAEFDDRLIDADLVSTLVREQFPQWRDLQVRPVRLGGNDHRMFRLGNDLCARLPSAPGYVPQVAKEQRWLPRLGPHLPLPVPVVHGAGRASSLFPAPWSVYGWLDGEPASAGHIDDPVDLGERLSAFLVALRAADPGGGPAPGLHSGYRGGPLDHYDDEVRDLLPRRLDGRERDRASGLWRDALAATFTGAPQWFHGDVSTSNLLVREGALSAVLDFGCAGVGDTACDTVLFWTQLHGRSREAYREGLRLDDATWARGRGWALWKALIMVADERPGQAELGRHVIDELLAGA